MKTPFKKIDYALRQFADWYETAQYWKDAPRMEQQIIAHGWTIKQLAASERKSRSLKRNY